MPAGKGKAEKEEKLENPKKPHNHVQWKQDYKF